MTVEKTSNLTERLFTISSKHQSLFTDFKDRIGKHRNKLIEFMEIRFGLLQELLSLGILSREDYDEISCEKNVIMKKRKLVELILDKKDVKHLADFRIALERTGQQHVLNYLDWDGGEIFIIFCIGVVGLLLQLSHELCFVAGLLI